MIDRLLRPFHESGTGTGDDGNGGTGDDGSGSQSTDAPGGQGSSQEQDPKDQMVPASELEKVRKEAAKYRTERNTAQKKADELEKAQLSDQEKLQKERDELKTSSSTLEQDNRALRVRVLAEDVGIVREARADAAQLLNWAEIEDASDDAQVKKALEDLTKDRPYLLGTSGGADGGAGGSRQAGSGDMNKMIRSAAGR
jgi:hypothetical protein